MDVLENSLKDYISAAQQVLCVLLSFFCPTTWSGGCKWDSWSNVYSSFSIILKKGGQPHAEEGRTEKEGFRFLDFIEPPYQAQSFISKLLLFERQIVTCLIFSYFGFSDIILTSTLLRVQSSGRKFPILIIFFHSHLAYDKVTSFTVPFRLNIIMER